MDAGEAFARLVPLLGALMSLMSCSLAREFYVGGTDGWVLNPHESYDQWSGRNRFVVHDKLVFKYKKGEDSVLVVNKADYDGCNTANPNKKLEDGNSVFELDRTGPFYFISGAPGKCAKGEKLQVVVLSAKSKKPGTAPASSASPQPPMSSPSPSSASPISSPSKSPSSSPSPSSSVSSPSPSASSPSSSPSPSPSSTSQSPSLSPASAPSLSPLSPTTQASVPSPSPGVSSSPSARGPAGATPVTGASGAPATSPSTLPSASPPLTTPGLWFALVASSISSLFLG